MKVSDEISAAIRKAIAALAPEPVGHINFEGIRYQALPLYGGIGEVWLLRPDGSFWRADSDAGLELERLPEELQINALVAGAERYPWLASLLPDRPIDAALCTVCGGTGRIGSPGNTAYCFGCHSLGWNSPSDPSG